MKVNTHIVVASCLMGSALGHPGNSKRSDAIANVQHDIAETIVNHRISTGPDSGKTMVDLALDNMGASQHAARAPDDKGSKTFDLDNLGDLGDLDNLGNSNGKCPIEDFLNAVGFGFGDLLTAITGAVGDATGALCDKIASGDGLSRREEAPAARAVAEDTCPIVDILDSLGIGVDDLVKSITKSVGSGKGALCKATQKSTKGSAGSGYRTITFDHKET